ncbi:hypothetical protein GCM10010954_23970 [Halobacillus andaensis]|uniref:Uncharacterized protein n=1 Tax=Halobacillus andaensis TaxID=1176239 RepID=A0A917EYV2_HALAA|nr:hypothetical protein [Halobacillus andaensis]MBP2006013.1 hypothetical protein [Halobacillus andaensis]GGF24295.1 hypothetical protein GCM10010954_23970 [Halobacillus andaensis]
MEIHLHDNYNLGENEIALNKDIKDEISDFFIKYIQNLTQTEKNFDLSLLKHIYVPNDYTTELYEFQRAQGLREGHTKNEKAEGQAMVLTYDVENDKKLAIFIRAEMFFGVFTSLTSVSNEFPDETAMCLNVFYHELVHVSDDFVLDKVIDFKSIQNNGILNSTLTIESLKVWQEYYAYRKAAQRYPYGDIQSSHLKEISDWIIDETESLKEQFQVDNDMEKFMEYFTYKTRYFLRVLVSVVGNIQGLNISQERKGEMLDLIKEKAINSKFASLIDELDRIMNELFNSYPQKWRGNHVLNDLIKFISDFWNKLDVYPSEISDSEVYVGID